MPRLQTANIMLALGGDVGQTVQRYGQTAAEIAVLQKIHGSDSVTDIRVLDREYDVNRSYRDELTRLRDVYGKLQPDGRHAAPAVDSLFPGAAARVFETIDELDLDESFFHVDRPIRPDPVDVNAATADEGPEDTRGVTRREESAKASRADAAGAPVPTRERGKPAPNRTKRTPEEKTADENARRVEDGDDPKNDPRDPPPPPDADDGIRDMDDDKLFK